MVNVFVPVFVNVNVCVRDEHLATVPNALVPRLTLIVVASVGSVALAPVKPMQPDWHRHTSRLAKIRKLKGLSRLGWGPRACRFLQDRDSIAGNR